MPGELLEAHAHDGFFPFARLPHGLDVATDYIGVVVVLGADRESHWLVPEYRVVGDVRVIEEVCRTGPPAPAGSARQHGA